MTRWLRASANSTMHSQPVIRWAVAAGVAFGAIGAGLTQPARRPTVLLIGVVAVAVVLTWERREGLAWLAGALLPIEVVHRIPISRLEGIHLLVMAAACLRFRPGLTGGARKVVMLITGLVMALALATWVLGRGRDPFLPASRFAGITIAAAIIAALLAFRPTAHRPVLFGYLAGVTASSAVALLQAVGPNLGNTIYQGQNRYPGFAQQAPTLSWHLAAAIPVAVAIAATSSVRWIKWVTYLQLAVCTAALLVCGAQGGLVGLGLAALLTARHWWKHHHRITFSRPVILAAALTVIAIPVLTVMGLGVTSITGLAGDPQKGFENETSRLQSLRYGLNQLTHAPLRGSGIHAYDLRYDVRPHFLPLNAGVGAGGLGVAIGVTLVGLLVWMVARGARVDTPSAVLGVALLSTLFVHVLLAPSGPFAGLERLSMLFIGVTAAFGASAPFRLPEVADPARPTRSQEDRHDDART